MYHNFVIFLILSSVLFTNIYLQLLLKFIELIKEDKMILSSYFNFCIHFIIILQFLYFSVKSDSMIRKMSKMNWQVVSKNQINSNCTLNGNGTCSGYCPFSSQRCVILWNYDTMVCGCRYCSFNKTTNRCYGQCNNLVLGTCLSIVDNPKSDSDCDCRYCKASVLIDNYGQIMPRCNAARCGPHTCSPVMLNTNATSTNLECVCNNI